MCLGLVDAQAFQQPAKLLRAEAQQLFLAPGPLVPAPLQALVQQEEAVRIPIKSLEAVCPIAAEQEERVGKRIQLKAVLYDAHQPVDAPAQICVPAGNVDN